MGHQPVFYDRWGDEIVQYAWNKRDPMFSAMSARCFEDGCNGDFVQLNHGRTRDE